jgi:hypothetical protein
MGSARRPIPSRRAVLPAQAGKDTFILTPSVIAALKHWRAFAGTPKTKSDRAKVQAAFNAWTGETSLLLAHLSMTLALSVD